MGKKKMTLSIITINYNNAPGLQKTLRSVASQTCQDFEHIIIDGASTDGSVQIIEEYAKNHNSSLQTPHSSLRWLSEPDKGIYNAMNKGIRMAEGDYIQILNSGDCLAGDDVEKDMMQALDEAVLLNGGEGVPILYGNMIKQWSDGKRIEDTCLGHRTDACKTVKTGVRLTDWTMDDFITGTINHDPTYIRRDLFEKYGLYDEEMKICSDWKWFVKSVVFGGEKVFYVPMNVTIFDMGGISETNMALREEERWNELRKFLPEAVLKDYSCWHFPIQQLQRLRRHHLWFFVYFIERVLFKFEKWGMLKK